MPDTIRARLLLLMMTVLLPAMAAALFVVARTYQGERDALARNLRDSARTVAQVLDRELARRADVARTMASAQWLVNLQGDDGPDPMLFHAWARQAVQELGGWVELHSATHELVDTRLPAGTPPVPHEPGRYTLQRLPAVLPLAPGPRDGVPRAAVVQPVVLADGSTVLNLVITLPPEVLQRMVDAQNLPGNWVGSVVDSKMRVVARHPGGMAYVGRVASADIQDHFRRQREGAFRSISLDGVAVEGHFSKTPQGWAYVIASPIGPLWAGVPDAVLKVVLGALVLLAVAGVAALWVARSIAGAVVSLKNAAHALQAGGPVAVGRTGIRECDEVASTLAESARVIGTAREHLEQQVAAAVARTRRAEQRVAQGQRIAALGRLTAGVAHDFNNLLGVISNSAHLIGRHADRPELQRPVAATLRAVETGSQLSRQLLRFGGHQPMRPQAVPLAQYLPDLRGLLEMVVHRHIQISFDVQPGTLPVNVDPSELELALTNVALNARDAMPDGGHLWVQARNAAAEETEGLAPGAYVLVAVTDDGNGMDESLVAQVFEPFFTTKGVGEGTGLGLSQVHGFCEQAGGTARVASTPGLGSTVSLLLPASVPQGLAETAASTPLPAAPSAQAGAALAGRKVLLVEDNDELADVTTLLLESFGCEVRRARHVADALAQSDVDPAIDLVLTDVVMPGARDGVALARALRQRHPQLPVVIISGYSASLAGLTEFPVLRKPVSADLLVATLVAALQGEGQGPQSGVVPAAGTA